MLAASLGPVVGYKIGCTTRALQEFMGIDNPCAGAIFASTVFQPGVRLELTDFVRPGIECEIGVRLRAALDPRDGPIDRKRAAQAVEAIFTSIEIVDERYVDYRELSIPVLVADNFMNAGCIKGAEHTDVDPLALDRARGSTLVNGETVGAGVGADILGHPLEALIWLGNELGSRGRPLQAGMFVSLGSMVKPYFPQAGDRVAIVNDMLGEVSLTVA